MRRESETLVIGAGISGLAYAHARGPDADLLVLEGSDCAGGLVRTVAEGGLRWEEGPEALQSGNAEVEALLRELGLATQEVPSDARRRWVVHQGRLVDVPMGPKELLRTPLLTARGKLRALTERWRDPKTALDGSVADFVRHRLGSEILAALVDPLISGIYAGDPEQISLRGAFPDVARMVEEHKSLMAAMAARRGRPKPGLLKPKGGMSSLTDALAAALGDRLLLSTPVSSLHRERSTWVATTAEVTLAAPTAVLATSARAAGYLLRDCAPDAAHELAAIQGENVVSVAHLWPRERVAHPLDGFGYLVPSRERLHHLGTLFSSSIDPASCPPDRVLLRTMLGGACDPGAVDRFDDEILTTLVSDLRPLLGLEGRPEWSRIVRYRGALPRYDLDHPRRIAALERALPDGLSLLGNFHRGIGLTTLIPAARTLSRSHGDAASTVLRTRGE
jgi:oxygen-dependent protoporphyrinogen oxidase